MRGSLSKLLLWLGGTAAAFGQLSPYAYRVLGQRDLQSNGLNMLQGTELQLPGGIALDPRGGQLHIYICDTGNSRVLGWADAASYQTGDAPAVVLGQLGAGYSGANAIGVKGLSGPTAAAVDPNTGDLYVADSGNNRVVRFPSPFANPARIEPDAVFGQPNFSSVTGGSSQSRMNQPFGLAFDSAGNLWVGDSGNNRVLRFNAGSLGSATPPAADAVIGQRDYTSSSANQGGGASASTLYAPAGVAFDDQGNLYVADFGNARVVRFAAASLGTANAAANAVWGQPNLTTRGAASQASATTLGAPLNVAVDHRGILYVSTPSDNRVLAFPADTPTANSVLGQTDFTTTTANTGAAPMASASTLSSPADVKLDSDGNLYVADAGNNRVLWFNGGAKAATRLWGQADFLSNGANQVKATSINAAYKMAIDYSKTPYALYISDIGNHRILGWRDSAAFRNGDAADLVIGQPNLRTAISNVDTGAAGKPSRTSLSYPAGLAVNPYDGTLYVADSGNHRVLRFPRPVDQSGRITPDAVIGQVDFTSNTSAAVTAASLNTPTGLALGNDGHLFVADTGNNRVLEFPSGAGTGAAAIRVYGQPNMFSASKPAQNTAQTLNAPRGLSVDAGSNLYVVDAGGNRVLLFANTQDAPAASAFATYPIAGVFKGAVDVAVDSSGNIFVSDSGNNRVLEISSPIAIAGPSIIGVIGQPDAKSTATNWDGSNGLASPDSLYAPLGLYIDRQDTLYIGDSGNNRVLHFLKLAVVVNAASFQTGAPVARGSLATLTGTGLAGDTASSPADAWPTTLLNHKVVVNDDLEAPVSLMSPGQVNFQVPSAAPVGTQRVAVRTADTGELIAGGTLLVSSVSPALFTASQNGVGQGLIRNQDGSMNSASNPASAGTTITLFGTGQGQVSPAVADGSAASGSPVSATIAVPTTDGKTCVTVQPSMCVAIGSAFGTVQESGLMPGYVGLWQVKVTLPTGLTSGSAVPVRVVLNGSPSNIVTLAVR